jgi:alpha-D-ribose 1-methylphosphonate 5-triphosphate synthase subunit PhnG
MTKENEQNIARKAWMSLLAKSDAGVLAQIWANADIVTDFRFLRAPEIGGVMVRGRAGAVGAAFNLGEMTVTRCSITLEDGAVGHAYVQGRDKKKATVAAQVDALMQTNLASQVDAAVLGPLREVAKTVKQDRAAKAAATKVDFFTIARGED